MPKKPVNEMPTGGAEETIHTSPEEPEPENLGDVWRATAGRAPTAEMPETASTGEEENLGDVWRATAGAAPTESTGASMGGGPMGEMPGGEDMMGTGHSGKMPGE